MTTYTVYGTYCGTTVKHTITVETDLSPEDEIQYAEDAVLDAWEKLFDINVLEEVTTEKTPNEVATVFYYQ